MKSNSLAIATKQQMIYQQMTGLEVVNHTSSVTGHTLDIRWALTYDCIATMQVKADFEVSLLKEQVAKATKTPVEYLVLLVEGSVLEAQYLADAGLSTDASITVLVARKTPEEDALLQFLKSKVKIGLMSNFFSWPEESQEDLELVQFILDCDIGVNNKDGRWNLQDDDPSFCGCTALHYASLCGLSGICHLLLNSPNFIEVNSTAEVAVYGKTFRGIIMKSTRLECTALDCAVAGAHSDVCSFLLAHPRFTQGEAEPTDRRAPHHAIPIEGFQGRMVACS